MNKILLIGNLTRDPESGSTQSGVNFTRFQIAVNRPFTDSSGERVADYFDIIAWRQIAELCAKYLFKGNKVGIHGSVQRRQYEDRDGIKRTSFDVVADELEFLTPRNAQDAGQSSAPHNSRPNNVPSDMQPVDNDDLPF